MEIFKHLLAHTRVIGVVDIYHVHIWCPVISFEMKKIDDKQLAANECWPV